MSSRAPDWQSKCGSVRLYQGDCLPLMPALEPGIVDAIIADLPYGTTACKWDTVLPFDQLWAGYRHVLKPRGAVVLTASQPFTSALIGSNLKEFRYCWVWNKRRSGNPFLAKSQPLKIHEDICVFSRVKHSYYPQMRTGKMKAKGGSAKSKLFGVTTSPSRNDQYYPSSIVNFTTVERDLHPTQKPVALMEYLIRTYTNEGELVLDNTMGSGTTIIAAMRTGRKAIGMEKDPDIFATAVQRIEAELAKQPLLREVG